MRALLVGTAVLAIVVGCFAPAADAAPNNTRLIATLEASHARFGHGPNVDQDLLRNCELFFSGGLALQGNPPIAAVSGPATGTLNPRTRRGEAFARHSQWQVEALAPSRARPVTFSELGFALRGSSLFLTGRLTHGRSFTARAGRKKLAVARHARITPGPLLDQRRRPLPATYHVLIRGKLRMLSAMARPIERLRCKGSRNRQSRRLKPRYLLGRLTVSYRPNVASGLAGNAELPIELSTDDSRGDPVTVDPTGGATLKGGARVVAQFASGLPLPVFCFAGEGCRVSGGTVGLAGGFDLVLGARRTSVTGLAIAIGGKPPANFQYTVTGVLDGTPITIATGVPDTQQLDLTGDFVQRVSAALGTQVTGVIPGLTLNATTVGPAG